MADFDNQSIGIICLTCIAFAILFFAKVKGLDVVVNVICTIGGIVTGKALSEKA